MSIEDIRGVRGGRLEPVLVFNEDNRPVPTTVTGTSSGAPIYVTQANDGSRDAFYRMRISNPQTIFDSKLDADNAPLLWDDQEVSGSGTGSSHSTAEAAVTLSVGANTAGKRVRQTYQSFNYQPGKSQLVELTGVLGAGASGITTEIGYGNDNNGLFFRVVDGTPEVKIVTQSAYGNQTIQQSNWTDRLDGTGASGHTVNWDRAQIFVIDFEWLAVGTVRFGIFHNGEPIYFAYSHNDNKVTGAYMSTPNLPIRYSIENDGTGPASTMKHICSTVISEGGREELGVLHYIDTDGVHLDANTADTVYALIGMRLRTGYLNRTINLIDYSVFAETATNYQYFFTFNPTVDAVGAWTTLTNSAVEYYLGATANTVSANGERFGGGYAANRADISGTLNNARRMGAAIDGTPDEVWLCIRPLSNNADIQGSIGFRQL